MLWMLLVALSQVTPAFVTIAQGRNSGIDEPRQVVVRTAAEWQALWKAHGSSDPAPAVDLSSEIVAAVFLGTRPTGGYSVEIVATRRDAAALVVEYVERRPPPDALLTQALTAPFHIVRLPRHDGPVRIQAAASGVR